MVFSEDFNNMTGTAFTNLNDENNECPICIGELTDKSITTCGHIFCKHCIIKALFPLYYGKCPYCRTEIDLQSTKLVEDNTPLVLPKPLTIYGSIYIQGKLKGLASYHFDSPDDCYISYASPQCNMWPELDDGSRPPEKKPFLNTNFDLSERTFTGEIHWASSPWQGDALWKYRMVFSEDFNSIVGGDVFAYNALENGFNTAKHTFGYHLVYERLYEDHVYE